jgi:hypothetical protein
MHQRQPIVPKLRRSILTVQACTGGVGLDCPITTRRDGDFIEQAVLVMLGDP